MLVPLARLPHSHCPAWLRLYEASLARQLAHCSGQTLVNTCWAMVKLAHRPGHVLLQELLQQLQLWLQYPTNSSSSSSSSSLRFTPAGLSLLLLSLVQSLPPGVLAEDWWRQLLAAVTTTTATATVVTKAAAAAAAAVGWHSSVLTA